MANTGVVRFRASPDIEKALDDVVERLQSSGDESASRSSVARIAILRGLGQPDKAIVASEAILQLHRQAGDIVRYALAEVIKQVPKFAEQLEDE